MPKTRKSDIDEEGKSKVTVIEGEVDPEYADSSSESGTSLDEGDKSDEVEISNKEVKFDTL